MLACWIVCIQLDTSRIYLYCIGLRKRHLSFRYAHKYNFQVKKHETGIQIQTFTVVRCAPVHFEPIYCSAFFLIQQ